MKLLAFDLDGTTLRHHKAISSENFAALKQAGERGVHLVPATGRVHSFLPEEIFLLPNVRYLICSNGAMIYDSRLQKTLYQNNISNSKAIEILSCLQQYTIYTELYINGNAYTQHKSSKEVIEKYSLQSKNTFFLNKRFAYTENLMQMLKTTDITPEKVNLPHIPTQLQAKLRQDLQAVGGIKLTSSISGNLEINAETATKGEALKWLAQHLGLSQEQVMAVGDNGNDIEMLRYAGCSIAIGDGVQQALEAAKYITDTCERNGLAKAIEKYLLS